MARCQLCYYFALVDSQPVLAKMDLKSLEITFRGIYKNIDGFFRGVDWIAAI